MVTYERATVVDAPLDTVWAFHADPAGLEAVTPEWLGLTVESVDRPADSSEAALPAGTVITIRVTPFGILPASRWRSHITASEYSTGQAMFRDESDTPGIDRWVHTHRFESVSTGTLIHDRVEVEASIPGLSLVLPRLLAPLFALRHRRAHQVFD